MFGGPRTALKSKRKFKPHVAGDEGDGEGEAGGAEPAEGPKEHNTTTQASLIILAFRFPRTPELTISFTVPYTYCTFFLFHFVQEF